MSDVLYSMVSQYFADLSTEFQKIVRSHCVMTKVTIFTFIGAQSPRMMQSKRALSIFYLFNGKGDLTVAF